MIVHIHKSQLTYFRKKARNSPNEQLAYLIGQVKGKEVTISKLVYPPLLVSTPSLVQITIADYNDILKEAKESGQRLVGSIHSHPGWTAVMSPTDFKGHLEDGDTVSGIVEVTTDRKTRVLFWSAYSALPCELHYR